MKKNKINLLKLKLTPLYQLATVKKSKDQQPDSLMGDTIMNTICSSF